MKKDSIQSFYRGGSVKHPEMNKVLNLRIYIPTIKVQDKIVSILNKYDILINDIKIGLPAEIDSRKKQYEYYRDLIFSYLENKKQ